MQDKFFWPAVSILVFLGMAILMFIVVPNKIKKDVTKDVMSQIQRDYVPGPYTPGFNPDVVPPTKKAK